MFFLLSTTPADSDLTRPHETRSRLPQVVAITFLILVWTGLMSFGITSLMEPEWLQKLSSQGKYQEAKDYKNMADHLLRQGNTGLSISHYHRALEIKPDYVDARVNLGVALGKAGRPTEAMAVLHEGLQMDPPSESVIWFNLAEVSKQTGDTLAAIEYYEKALEEDSDPEHALIRLGLLYEHHHDWEKAFNCFNRAFYTQLNTRTSYRSMLMRSIPHYQRPRDSLHLRVLEEQLSEGVGDELMALYDTTLIRQLTNRANLGMALTHMGVTSLALEKPEQAVVYLERAMMVEPRNREAAGVLARLREENAPAN